MRELICIVCPKGCHLSVDENNDYKVTGADCKRGEDYGKTELCDPRRVITSTVTITGAVHNLIPVKSTKAIPKDMVFKVMELLKSVKLSSPVKNGEIVIQNVLNTGVDIVTTRSL